MKDTDHASSDTYIWWKIKELLETIGKLFLSTDWLEIVCQLSLSWCCHNSPFVERLYYELLRLLLSKYHKYCCIRCGRNIQIRISHRIMWWLVTEQNKNTASSDYFQLSRSLSGSYLLTIITASYQMFGSTKFTVRRGFPVTTMTMEWSWGSRSICINKVGLRAHSL